MPSLAVKEMGNKMMFIWLTVLQSQNLSEVKKRSITF